MHRLAAGSLDTAAWAARAVIQTDLALTFELLGDGRVVCCIALLCESSLRSTARYAGVMQSQARRAQSQPPFAVAWLDFNASTGVHSRQRL
jgi:hypothetical protein